MCALLDVIGEAGWVGVGVGVGVGVFGGNRMFHGSSRGNDACHVFVQHADGGRRVKIALEIFLNHEMMCDTAEGLAVRF